jgi:hypothetical protein
MKIRILQAIKLAIVLCFILCIGLTAGEKDAFAKRGKTPKKQCQYTRTCNYTVVVDGFTYNVTGGATYYRTCGSNTWPSWGCNLIRSEIIDRINPGNLSMNWGLSCGNTHFYNATIWAQPGVCGSSHGGSFPTFPGDNLCTVGIATATSSANGIFNWTCDGINGAAPAQCSATQDTSFDLSCYPSPSTGVANQQTNFNADISNSTEPEYAYTFTWDVNGTIYNDDDTLDFYFPSATNTASVKVRAELNGTAKEVICPFNRVDCEWGQYYCGDQSLVTSYSCVNTPEECPNSRCGDGYDISLDKSLNAGGTLPTVDPGNSFVQSNGLCLGLSELKYLEGVSTWTFSPGYSTWQWSCKEPNAINTANCKARCVTGEYYCVSAGSCVPDSQACDCPLGTSGNTVDQRLYCLDDRNNQCNACGQVVSYFKLLPDEILKNQGQSCGAYWETIPIAEENKPENTTATRVVCNLRTGASVQTVNANNAEGGIAYPVGIASHELVCTQQYQLQHGQGVWFDLLSSSMSAKCRALPGTIER